MLAAAQALGDVTATGSNHSRLHGRITTLAQLAEHLNLPLTIAQQIIADGYLLQPHCLDGVFDLVGDLKLYRLALTGGGVLPRSPVTDHAGGQETQEKQTKCRQHLVQQRQVVDPTLFLLRHAGVPRGATTPANPRGLFSQKIAQIADDRLLRLNQGLAVLPWSRGCSQREACMPSS